MYSERKIAHPFESHCFSVNEFLVAVGLGIDMNCPVLEGLADLELAADVHL